MDLKKGKHFTPTEEDSTFFKRRKSETINKELFPGKFVVSLLFLFSNVQKIPLWLSSIRQQFDIFWKLLENLQGKVCDEDHICEDIKTT